MTKVTNVEGGKSRNLKFDFSQIEATLENINQNTEGLRVKVHYITSKMASEGLDNSPAAPLHARPGGLALLLHFPRCYDKVRTLQYTEIVLLFNLGPLFSLCWL